MSYDHWENLLSKYEKKHSAEVWSPESEAKRKQLYYMKQRVFLFDRINSQYFRFKDGLKGRALYIIKKLDFNKFGKWSEEQIIATICWYVEVEKLTYYDLKNYKGLFNKFKISEPMLIQFLINMNKMNIELLYH